MGSVTDWLAALREGDRDAAQPLWDRYYSQLVRIARAKLRELSVPLADEEDIALVAFDSFFRGIEANRFPDVCDRENFWHLLLFIAGRKAASAVRFETSQRRNRARVTSASDSFSDFDELSSDELSPETAYATAESLRELLDELADRQLKEIAILRMEGHTPAEIAARFGCSDSTIKRKLRRIRETWSHHIGH